VHHPPAASLARRPQAADHGGLIALRGLLQFGPPLRHFADRLPGLGPQQQEIIGRAEPRVREQAREFRTCKTGGET